MKHRIITGKVAGLLVLLLCLPLAGLAAGQETARLTEKHVYELDGEETLIPQPDSAREHLLSPGESITLAYREFPGFLPQGGAAAGDQRSLTAGEDREVIFRYDRARRAPIAQVRVATEESSGLDFLRESLSSLRVSLRLDRETLQTLPVLFTEGVLDAEVEFAPVYSHTPEGERIAYRVMAEDPPAGFVSEAAGLELLLRPITVWVTVTHAYDTGDGAAPIPQRDAEYTLECHYGDALLIPNRDFEGFAADVEKPNIYLENIERDQRVTFYHRRRVGVYGQLAIDAGASNRPEALPGLIAGDAQVELLSGGQVSQRSTAFFSGERQTASVSFPGAPTHTPEGSFIDYSIALHEVPEGFSASGQGLSLSLSPVPLTVPVEHAYAPRPGVYLPIPQEGAAYPLSATYGDEVFIEDRDFPGFLPDPLGDRYLPALDEEEPVRFAHERTIDRVETEFLLLGEGQTHVDQLTRELSGAFLLLRGGELPEGGLRLVAAVSGGADGIRVRGSLDGLYTHAPDGTPYQYEVELRDFAALAPVASEIEPGQLSQETAELPERAVHLALRYEENGREAPIPQEGGEVRIAARYGDQLQITPPELSGFVPVEGTQVVIPYLTEDETHVLRYARQTDGPISVALEWQEEALDAQRPQEVGLRLLRGNSAGQEEYHLALATGPELGMSQQTAFDRPHTHDLRGAPYDQEELLVELGEAPYDLLVEAIPEGYRVSLWPYGGAQEPTAAPVEVSPAPEADETIAPEASPEASPTPSITPTPAPVPAPTQGTGQNPTPTVSPSATPQPTQGKPTSATVSPAPSEPPAPSGTANPPPTAAPATQAPAAPQAPAPTEGQE